MHLTRNTSEEFPQFEPKVNYIHFDNEDTLQSVFITHTNLFGDPPKDSKNNSYKLL